MCVNSIYLIQCHFEPYPVHFQINTINYLRPFLEWTKKPYIKLTIMKTRKQVLEIRFQNTTNNNFRANKQITPWQYIFRKPERNYSSVFCRVITFALPT